MQFKSFNIIYLTLITQKAERTCRRVLEGVDVGVLWWRKLENQGKPLILDRRQLPCHMPTPEFNPGSQQASALTTALLRPISPLTLEENIDKCIAVTFD